MSAGHYRGEERGVVTVIAVLGLLVLLGIGALAVDYGMLLTARAQLSTAADAASLAAVKELAFGSRERAVERAIEYAALNRALGDSVVLTPRDVTLGFYDFELRQFRGEELLPNAVQVTARRTGSDGSVPTYFAAVFGRRHVDVAARSIAIGLPRTVVVAIDASGSMGEALPCGTPGAPAIVPARESAADFVTNLHASTLPERAGVLSFALVATERASIADLHGPGQPDQLRRRTLEIVAAECGEEGSTNTGAAIELATQMFEETTPGMIRGGQQKMLVLLSDGLANRDRHGDDYFPEQGVPGNPAWRYAVEAARDAYEQAGIVVHTITLGDNGQRQQMREIAEAGGGGMALVAPTPDDLDEMFETLSRNVQVALVR